MDPTVVVNVAASGLLQSAGVQHCSWVDQSRFERLRESDRRIRQCPNDQTNVSFQGKDKTLGDLITRDDICIGITLPICQMARNGFARIILQDNIISVTDRVTVTIFVTT